jgi:type IV pilus assembly protein PilW
MRVPFPDRARGMGLIELMVALLISLVIVGAVSYLYAGNRQAMRTQMADSRLTDNKRIAIDALSREFRHAARIGCTRASRNQKGSLLVSAAFPVMGNSIVDIMPMMTEPTSYIRLENGTPYSGVFKPGAKIRGYDDGVGFTTILNGTRVPGTDVIQILRTGDYASQLAVPMSSPSTDPNLTAPIPTALAESPEQLFVIADCDQAEIVRASVKNGTTLGGSLNISRAGWNDQNSLRKSYGTDAFVSQFDPVIYMVISAPDEATLKLPRLVRYSLTRGGSDAGRWSLTPEVIADGIENMQLRFGVSRSGSNSPDSLLTADEINALGMTAEQKDEIWQTVRSVEIKLMIVSDGTAAGREPIRQTLTHSVSLRNLML